MADATPQGNPAVVGLAGFATTTLLLQFHNLGLCGTGVIFCCALAFGGGAQLLAGLQEFKAGNNFGYSAFSSYGAFWIALAFIFLLLDLQGAPNSWVGAHLKIGAGDLGWFLVAYTCYTVILWIGSFAVHTAMIFTFTTLLIGFIGLDLEILAGMKSIKTFVALDLVLCAMGAYYMMAHVIFLQVFGRDVLPVGKAWAKKG
ncbi:acetate uptake transporter [Desulfogranum marinum]|uniref:acetate uptake transporter n=1 Tax=Desulfogranum marinum TaxID=453220 RepID=UPI001965C517|nr:acetate uptake transporter [Desulfogranum marinum]MBM9512590.1 acetate uptake transporter [Desulfogranum marinum]